MGRKIKHSTQEDRKVARREQSQMRRLKTGAKEARRKENRKAYAKRKVIAVPQPSAVVQALASTEISENHNDEHLLAHYSINDEPLELPNITLTNTDFQNMIGHPPYPCHIVNLTSFEKDWPKISAAFQGYATRTFVSEQVEWIDQAVNLDRASLSSDLAKLYQDSMANWEQFGVDMNSDCLATEFIAFQNRLWTSRRLTWLAEDLSCLVKGKDALILALQERIQYFRR